MDERRSEDRRKGDRRLAPRNGPDRRQGDRRQLAAAAAFATAFVCFAGSEASAQIYTRTNAKGVIEATDTPEDPGDYRLAYPKRKGIVIHSAEFKVRPSTRAEFDEHINNAAAWHGVPVPFVRAVIQTESQFDPRAVSSVGAQGLMQLMPATARRFGVADPFQPQQNIFGGVRYLKWLLDKFGGNQALAAAGYNAGENAVVRYGGIPPYRETQHYVRKVMALVQGSDALPAVAPMPVAAAAAVAVEPPPTVTLASYTPGAPPVGGVVTRAAGPGRKAEAPKPARKLYRWKDERGVPHVSETPPATGEYVTLRASD
jgi:hypothetical protein